MRIAIAGAGAIGALQLVKSGDPGLGYEALSGALIAFFVGWFSIAAMMKWLEKSSFAPFAIYRIILGCGLLLWINF